MPPERDIGPTAAFARSLLTEEQIELFDWFTSKIIGPESEVKFFASLMQGVGCYFPQLTYWEVVKIARDISSAPDFNETRARALAQSEASLKKPPES